MATKKKNQEPNIAVDLNQRQTKKEYKKKKKKTDKYYSDAFPGFPVGRLRWWFV